MVYKDPEYQKKWFVKNIEHRKKYQKKYQKKWYKKNLEHRKKYYNQWVKNKRLNDPDFRVRCNLRTRIWTVLKGHKKVSNTMKLIGCSMEQLWQHLESKFQNGMTRKNYGKGGWDVDHIKPCAHFDLTDPKQQRICFHWTNLQPMWHIENIKKGARV